MSTFKGFKKIASLFVAVVFLCNTILPNAAFAAEAFDLPGPSQFVNLSQAYSFPTLKGLRFDPANPLRMEFIVDHGNQEKVSQEEASSLIRYFLAGLTIPQNDLWVNLSPYEKDRIINDNLAQTDLGEGLLSQDYILKQISASLTYPESQTGRDFWNKTYNEILKIAKTTNIPVNTFNKIWIVPDKAVVYENKNVAFVAEASLKTMLEQDYLSLKNNVSAIQKDWSQDRGSASFNRSRSQRKDLKQGAIEQISKASSDVMRQEILPKINADINTGKNFATLRQIYSSIILAVWFKKKFKESLYQHYIDKGKIKGIDLTDKNAKEKVYNLYLQAFQKGLYNYIKTEPEQGSRKNIKRRYFSGGSSFDNRNLTVQATTNQSALSGTIFSKKVSIFPTTIVAKGTRTGTFTAGSQTTAGSTISAKKQEVAAVRKFLQDMLANKIDLKTLTVPASLQEAVKTQREYLPAGNWKMELTTAEEAIKLINGIANLIAQDHDKNTWRDKGKNMDFIIPISPSSVHIYLVKAEIKKLEDSGSLPQGLIRLGAQNASAYEKGPRTGENSATQLRNLGVEYVILGHSERRHHEWTPETSKLVNAKARQVLNEELKPIICIGETFEERGNGNAYKVLTQQLRGSTAGFTKEDLEKIVIAYEPVWAIGKGKTPATPEDAKLAHLFIRAWVLNKFGVDIAGRIQILYGGSVKPGNVADLIAQPGIDGALVGGEALKPEGFVNIAKAIFEARASSAIAQNITTVELLKTTKARQVLDSRGFPTVEMEVTLPDRKTISVIVPSGASTGKAEALELRDGQVIKDIGQGKRPELSAEQINRLKKIFPNKTISSDEELYKILGSGYEKKGVLIAADNASNIIIPLLIEALNKGEFTIIEQKKIDAFLIKLDGTENKSNLGANATLAVSLLTARIGAYLSGYGDVEFYKYIHETFGAKNPRIPICMQNVLNGGKHAPDGPDIQEFMIGAVGSAKTMLEQMEITTKVFHTFGDLLKNDEEELRKKYTDEAYKKYNLSNVLGRGITGSLGTAYGDEGGYVPAFENNREPFLAITAAIRLAGYNQNGKIDVALGMDGALSEWDEGPTKDGQYRIYHFKKPLVLADKTILGKQLENKKWEITSLDLIRFYKDLILDTKNVAYLFSIEDGLGEKDWSGAEKPAYGWEKLTEEMTDPNFISQVPFYNQISSLLKENYGIVLNGLQVVTDDPTSTNPTLTEKAITAKTGNALLDKINQIGTLTEAAEAGNLALGNGWNLFVSHRSGETEDVTIAHLSVGLGGGFLKTGAPNRTDRNAKYNELLRIEENMQIVASSLKIANDNGGINLESIDIPVSPSSSPVETPFFLDNLQNFDGFTFKVTGERTETIKMALNLPSEKENKTKRQELAYKK